MLKILPASIQTNCPHPDGGNWTSRDMLRRARRSAVEAAEKGYYVYKAGRKVDWGRYVQAACSTKISIPPGTPLPAHESILFPETRIQVANETTLGASRRLVERGLKPLTLNFANGVHPGGGFLSGPEPRRKCFAGRAPCTQR